MKLFQWLLGLLSPSIWSSEDEEDVLNSRIYVRQARSWDCGIACTTMALNWCAQGPDALSRETLDTTPMDAPAETPLWTIDMYCFLKRRGVAASFSTAVPGINASHTSLAWYAPHIEADRVRVEAMFEQARAAAWTVDAPVPTEQLVQLLQAQGDGPLWEHRLCAIVLVNSKHLYADPRLGGSGSVSTAGYAGHYVLVLGVTPDGRDVRYLDPAKDVHTRLCGVGLFDQGRRAQGTDMDLLLIRRGELPAPAPALAL